MRLLLLLISFNCFAEYEIKITPNDSTWAKSSIIGADQVDAELKLAKFAKKSKAHKCIWSEDSTDSIASKIVRENNGIDELPVMEDVTYYCKPGNYSFTGADVIIDTQAIALSEIKSDMEFGKNLYAKVRLIMKSKGLTKKQRKNTRKSLDSIRDDLFDGDICSAKEDISNITAGPIISQSNLDHVVNLINLYKVCE